MFPCPLRTHSLILPLTVVYSLTYDIFKTSSQCVGTTPLDTIFICMDEVGREPHHPNCGNLGKVGFSMALILTKKPILLSYTRNRKPHKPMFFFFWGLWQQSWSSLWGIVFAPSTLFLQIALFPPKISKCKKVVLGLIAPSMFWGGSPSPKHTTCMHKYCLKIIIEGTNYINQEKKSLTWIWVFANQVCNLCICLINIDLLS